MIRLFHRLRGHGDEGVGMILVIGTATVVMALVMVAGAIASRALDTGATHDQYGAMGAVAETGVEQGIARAQGAYKFNRSDYITPHAAGTAYEPNPTCVANPADYAYPATADTAAEEAKWARTKLLQLATVPGCLQTTNRGQYVFIRPTGRQAVYAMGWSPKYDPSARARVIKSEYIFAPFQPEHAILTGGSLRIESSSEVDTISGTGGAPIHSNGNITSSGNPTVTGTVSMSGGGTLPASGGFSGDPKTKYSPRITIPEIEARELYKTEIVKGTNASEWFDLCPGGVVRLGDNVGPDYLPCTGPEQGTFTTKQGAHFRGAWYFQSSSNTWIADGVLENGIYFAYQSNIEDGNNNDKLSETNPRKATLIAASVGTTCDKVAGNIKWDHTDIAQPYIQGLFMYADQDLLTTANLDLGSTTISGSFVAGDQVELDTSSAELFGSVIAADECDPAVSPVPDNLVKNPQIHFDPNGFTPLVDVVNTTLWLELTG